MSVLDSTSVLAIAVLMVLRLAVPLLGIGLLGNLLKRVAPLSSES